MNKNNDGNDGNKNTDEEIANPPTPETDTSGTYWIVRAPDHGDRQPNVIGFDEHFNYEYGDSGQIYCGNCEHYDFYRKINKVSTCKTCYAPFRASHWFNQHTYKVEVNGRVIKSGLSYEDAVSLASENRNPKNAIYVCYEKTDVN
jgi:hypothetical protein